MSLNGFQISMALAARESTQAGEISPAVAVEILIATGIERQQAETIIANRNA
jgi:hypothetical protein